MLIETIRLCVHAKFFWVDVRDASPSAPLSHTPLLLGPQSKAVVWVGGCVVRGRVLRQATNPYSTATLASALLFTSFPVYIYHHLLSQHQLPHLGSVRVRRCKFTFGARPPRSAPVACLTVLD